MNRIILAILVIALTIGGIFAYQYFKGQQGPALPDAVVNCAIGSEKKGFMADPEVQRILKDRFGLTVKVTSMGSVEQVLLSDQEIADRGFDCLWPSNDMTIQLFQLIHPGTSFKVENIFNSPIVFYTWKDVADTLVSEGVAEFRDGNYYVDPRALIQWMSEEKEWSDLGLPFYHTFYVESTAPTQSNSGNMWFDLQVNLLAGDTVVTERSVLAGVMPELAHIYGMRGAREESTGDLYDTYVTEGEGAHPLIVGYESLRVEYIVENIDYRDQIIANSIIMYPEPTMWSSHPIIALTENGERFLEAMSDITNERSGQYTTELHNIGLQVHGFRTALRGLRNDSAVLAEYGLPENLNQIISMPSPEVVLTMTSLLKCPEQIESFVKTPELFSLDRVIRLSQSCSS